MSAEPPKKRKKPLRPDFLRRGTFDPFISQLPAAIAPQPASPIAAELTREPAVPPPPPEGWNGLYHPSFGISSSAADNLPSPQMAPKDMIMSAVAHRRMEVPVDALMNLIGPQGQALEQMQQGTGCKLAVQDNTHTASGTRILSLSGGAAAVARTENLIQHTLNHVQHHRLLQEVLYSSPSLHPAVNPSLHPAVSSPDLHPDYTEDLWVPTRSVGLLIGPRGETIQSVSRRSGAAVVMTKDSEARRGAAERRLRICGTGGAVAIAKQLVADILSEEVVRNGGAVRQSMEVTVPQQMVGLLVGRQGSQIKQWQQLTATRIQISAACAIGTDDRVVTLVGSPAGMSLAKQLIDAKLNSGPRRDSRKPQCVWPQMQHGALKSDWEVCFDSDNRVVYINSTNGGSQYEYPFEMSSALGSNDDPTPHQY